MNTAELIMSLPKESAQWIGLSSIVKAKNRIQEMAKNSNRLTNFTLSPTDDDTKRVYSVEDIQKILGISRTTAYALIKQAPFRVVHIGNAIRISKVDFDRWLDNPEYRQEV